MAENLNISPDMINNLVNMLKNNGFNEESDNTNNSNSYNNYETADSSANTSSNNIDFETILKIKSIMETLNNSNDQDSKLLYSLQPYLRKSRQAKLDQYINILKISHISKLFNQKGDDN